MNHLEERQYTVVGMTCGQCVASVEEELGEVTGVSSVSVDLASGRLVVAGHGLTDAAVGAAIAAAGYEVVR